MSDEINKGYAATTKPITIEQYAKKVQAMLDAQKKHNDVCHNYMAKPADKHDAFEERKKQEREVRALTNLILKDNKQMNLL